MPAAQRQREKRLRKRLVVEFGEAYPLTHTGFTTNVSPRGLCITSKFLHAVGAGLTLEVRLRDGGVATLRGRVSWARTGTPTLGIPSMMGVQLLVSGEEWFGLVAEAAHVGKDGEEKKSIRPVAPIRPIRPLTTPVSPAIPDAPKPATIVPPPRPAPPPGDTPSSTVPPPATPPRAYTAPPTPRPSIPPPAPRTVPPPSRTVPPPAAFVPGPSGPSTAPLKSAAPPKAAPTLEELRAQRRVKREKRYEKRIPVTFGAEDAREFGGRTFDVGVGGAAIETLSLRPVGTTLQLEFELPNGARALCKGTVVRTHRFHLMQPEPNSMAVRFDDADADWLTYIATLAIDG